MPYLLFTDKDIVVGVPPIGEHVTQLQKIIICVAEMVKNYDVEFINLVEKVWAGLEKPALNKYLEKEIPNGLCEKQCEYARNTGQLCPPCGHIPTIPYDKEMGQSI